MGKTDRRQAVRATRCNVGVSSRVTKKQAAEGLPERDIARAQKGSARGRPSRRDGNGREGIDGYFTWVAERDLTFFYVELWSRLLELQIHEEAMSATNELGGRKKQLMTFELREGPDDEVRELMSLAIMRPKQFCKALCAAWLTPPKGWRARPPRAYRRRRQGGSSFAAPHQQTAQACRRRPYPVEPRTNSTARPAVNMRARLSRGNDSRRLALRQVGGTTARHLCRG
jgi:hypothetical protein